MVGVKRVGNRHGSEVEHFIWSVMFANIDIWSMYSSSKFQT